jgi:hypothetical protein
MKIELYSFEDAKYIIEYYKNDLVGINIGSEKIKMIITHLDLEEYENEKFSVICKCSLSKPFPARNNIESVLDKLKQLQPTEILKKRIEN